MWQQPPGKDGLLLAQWFPWGTRKQTRVQTWRYTLGQLVLHMQVLQLQDDLGTGCCASRTLVWSVAMFNVTLTWHCHQATMGLEDRCCTTCNRCLTCASAFKARHHNLVDILTGIASETHHIMTVCVNCREVRWMRHSFAAKQ